MLVWPIKAGPLVSNARGCRLTPYGSRLTALRNLANIFPLQNVSIASTPTAVSRWLKAILVAARGSFAWNLFGWLGAQPDSQNPAPHQAIRPWRPEGHRAFQPERDAAVRVVQYGHRADSDSTRARAA